MELRTFTTDLTLACGRTLPQARLVYAVWGRLNEAGDNLVLFPTRFGGTHEQNAWAVGPGKALDPARWCVVVPNMLGNGVSTSPSTAEHPQDGLRFPVVTHADNVALQRAMLDADFGGADIALAFGWSMGAQQGYRWAATHPERVKRLFALCGTARTSPHNRVFLESLLAALEADPRYRAGARPVGGLRAMGRIYAGWAYSQPWLKAERFRAMGYASLDDWLIRYWDALFERRDAGDLTAMLRTWIANDVADGGDLAVALGRITARTLVSTTSTDLYFTEADCRAEAAMIPGARYATLESDWGHMAGSGQNPEDAATIDAMLRSLLD
ncbi:MAG: alpha/beta fold hydrolase [Rhodobacteraceae bacterium]|nr:MAG: alpha/beta fold hydrolase [Paracoccaceae bacterium]